MTGRISITFMRHGRSRADDEKVHEGHTDSPLTEAGRARPRARTKDLAARGAHFDRIVASTFQRAQETAAIVGSALSVSVDADPDWQEMNSGLLAGLPFAVAALRYPPQAFRGPHEPYVETGESDWEVHARAARGVENVVRRGNGSYLVVAHGGILNAPLRTIVGTGPCINGQGIVFRFGDTGFVRMEYIAARHCWHMLELRGE